MPQPTRPHSISQRKASILRGRWGRKFFMGETVVARQIQPTPGFVEQFVEESLQSEQFPQHAKPLENVVGCCKLTALCDSLASVGAIATPAGSMDMSVRAGGMLRHPPCAQPPVTTVPENVLPELRALEKTIEQGGPDLQTRVVREVRVASGQRFPIYAISMGNPDPHIPAVGFFGGVHGLERIGAEVVIAYLQNIVMRLRWDTTLHQQLEQVRLVFMPIVNPGGMWAATRANPHGVDLMRNAPVEALDRVPWLMGGQRLSAGLPWYRGPFGAPMETESQALCEVVRTELMPRPFSLALDCHSGFGVRDRLWFPFAHTRKPIAHLHELHALKNIFLQAHSHHPYVIEPQSAQYLAHGDLWDYLYLQSCTQPERLFLPLTLEMGSWLWIKKNPRQLFSRLGIFNPLIDHRQQRVLRRHLALLDFLARAAGSHQRWRPSAAHGEQGRADALAEWY